MRSLDTVNDHCSMSIVAFYDIFDKRVTSLFFENNVSVV